MKNYLFIFLIIVSVKSFAQNTFQPPSAEIVKQAISKMPDHPRLLFLKEDIQGVKDQIKRNPAYQKLHDSIIAESDRLLTTVPVERIQIGKRLLDKSRECLRRVFFLGYAFRMTSDQKYLKRAETELLAVSRFSDWNPSHFLDVGEMTMAVSIGYDWLYHDLSEDSRKQMREAIIRLGIEPSKNKKYNSFLNASNNWNQVCNAGISFGALAIAEDIPELAAELVSRAIASVPKSVSGYAPDGAYPEGYGYWEYGTSFNVLLLSALEKALGTDYQLSNLPGFLKSAGFLQNMIGPSYQVHNWGDSGLKAGASPAMFWYASKLKDPSLIWMNNAILQQSGKLTGNRILPALLIWGKDLDLQNVTPPKAKMWVGQGPSPVGLMRTSWTDPQAIFVGFKAGSASVSHAHMDAGSFIIDALGERWAMDFGPQDYNSLETKGVNLWGRDQNAQRWEVFRYNNRVHNTLTVDNQLHKVNGYAKIDEWSDQKDNQFVISDLGKVFGDQLSAARRGVAIKNQKIVVVRDELSAPADRPVTVRWNLLTAAEVNIINENTVKLVQNGKNFFITFQSEGPLIIKTWPTTPNHDYDAMNPGSSMVGFEAIIPAGKSQSFTSVFAPKKGEKIKQTSLSTWKKK